ncbi:MAG: hypothetical protein ACE10D_01730, partial [Planctomycetota bacterium]
MIAIEQVFVVPRKDLFPKGAPHGFVAGAEPYLASIRRHGFFVERPAAEENPALKQVIPYAVLCCRDEIFLFTRRGGGGEKRLYGLRSVGVGGHINPIDAPRRPIDAPRRPIDGAMHGDDLVWEGLRRELLEEVGLQPGPPI